MASARTRSISSRAPAAIAAGAVRQHFEGERLQRVAGEDRGGFVEGAMTGRPAAAQIVVVHRTAGRRAPASRRGSARPPRPRHRAARAARRALRRWRRPAAAARACRRRACCSAWLRAGAASRRHRSRARAPARLRCAADTAEPGQPGSSAAPGARLQRPACHRVVIVVVVGERFDRFVAVARQQDFDLLLRRAQRGLALARERHAAFECLERLFERHVALLELRDEGFELGSDCSKSGNLFCLWGFDFTRATLNVARAARVKRI